MIKPVSFLPTLPSLLVSPKVPLIHRDLSWMQFNDRVLAEARQTTNPLLERVKFLAISSSNLDEFFMIRVSSLMRSISQMSKRDPMRAKRLTRIRGTILETVSKFGAKQTETLDLLISELSALGIQVILKAKPDEAGFELGRKIFSEVILPQLTAPETFSHYKVNQLDNLQMGALVGESTWFKISKTLPLIYSKVLEDNQYYFFLDDLLYTFLSSAFRLQGDVSLLRVTRDGDYDVDIDEEDTESIPDQVRTKISDREKGKIVRLQILGDFKDQVLTKTVEQIKIQPDQAFIAPNSFLLNSMWSIYNTTNENILKQPGLKHPHFEPYFPEVFKNPERLFEILSKQDLLLHHPYDSFEAYVEWIRGACLDPSVELIQQTVYRMDALSPIIELLKKAAKTKKIRVVIELRARFDELNNLKLTEDLRSSGVEVAFGFGQLKLHAKIATVVRNEKGLKKVYTHLSTGNYNASTARQYTDLAILTSNAEIGADALSFFNSVWDHTVPTSFKKLVPAPTKLHRKLVSHILQETKAATEGKKARIVAKVNALVDANIIQVLYEASQAGVEVDLIVRGACSLVPGVKNLSEKIRVISVVDKFLEHSRLYYFESSKSMYLSSADWMPRNFFSRLEIAFPVLDSHLFDYIEKVVIPAYLCDTVKARELTPQGTWKKRTLRNLDPMLQKVLNSQVKQRQVRSQQFFENLAKSRYLHTSLSQDGRTLD